MLPEVFILVVSPKIIIFYPFPACRVLLTLKAIPVQGYRTGQITCTTRFWRYQPVAIHQPV